ncbi:SGNH/GDSL hydrolase family protein [Azotobacter vinelandii]
MINNKIAFGPDSRSANCVGTAGGLTLENYGYIHWALMLSRQCAVLENPLVDNWGIGGNTSRDFKGRYAPLLAATEADTIILTGPTNDRGSANMSAWESIDNYTGIIDNILKVGKEVILLCDTPRGDTSFTGQALAGDQLTAHQIVRQWMLSQDNGGSILVADPYPDWVDAVSASAYARLGYTHDGLHPTPTGAYYMGKALAGALTRKFAGREVASIATNADLFSAANPNGSMVNNPMVRNTGTNGTLGTGGAGTIAQYWSGTNAGGASGITRTYDFTEDGVQSCVLSGAAAGTAAACDILRQTGLHTTLVPGATYEAFADIEVDAGTANFSSLQLGIEVTDPVNGTQRYWDGDRYLGTMVLPAVAYNGVLRVPKIVIPSGATAASLRLTAYAVDSAADVAMAMRALAVWMKRVK